VNYFTHGDGTLSQTPSLPHLKILAINRASEADRVVRIDFNLRE
jgi:hypothetical protein